MNYFLKNEKVCDMKNKCVYLEIFLKWNFWILPLLTLNECESYKWYDQLSRIKDVLGV